MDPQATDQSDGVLVVRALTVGAPGERRVFRVTHSASDLGAPQASVAADATELHRIVDEWLSQLG